MGSTVLRPCRGAAVSYVGGPVPFTIAAKDFDARSWYGQSALSATFVSEPTDRVYFGYPVRRAFETDLIDIEPITFETLTADLDLIEFVDMDLQGAEQELVEHAIDSLTAKARLVHIGTHSIEIEDAIRQVFRAAGWAPRWDFSLQGERDTPYGVTRFDDGCKAG